MVSVIIPAHNAALFLSDAIESVLQQTRPAAEIIVVDDGSTDGTRIIAESFMPHIRYFHQPQAGIGAARNRGIEAAHGSYLAFLDADDRWTQDKLAGQIPVLDENPEIDGVFGMVQQVSDEEWKIKLAEPEAGGEQKSAGLLPGAMLIRRSAFLQVGYFSTDVKLGEFVDWYLRAQERGLKFSKSPELVLWRRIHQTNSGIIYQADRTDYLKIIKRTIDRRRLSKHDL